MGSRRRRPGGSNALLHLSKSDFLNGLQCPKRLWLQRHPARVDAPRAGNGQGPNLRLEAGREVGRIARALYPDGVLISETGDSTAALASTRWQLQGHRHRLLFEPAFEYRDLLIRADIYRTGADGGHLIEVKSTTRVKDHHVWDCAVQAWVIEGSGNDLAGIAVAHVDNGFVYTREGDYGGLIVERDMTVEVRARQDEITGRVDALRTMLAGGEPAIDPGPQCTSPWECPFIGYCTEPADGYPVATLPRAGALPDQLRAEGYDDLRAVPPGRLANPVHERMRRAVIAGAPELDPELVHLVRQLDYPRYFLDFETIAFAVPIWLGTRPYEQLPFQWSCHVEDQDGHLTHAEFLDLSGSNPMRQFAERLFACLGERGPVLVYSSFERSTLRSLMRHLPDLAGPLQSVIDRLVDLLPPTRRHYYHPDMQGSWSIKAVLPTVAPQLDYAALGDVRNGEAAQSAYLEAIDPGTPEQRRAVLQRELLAYCRLDTLAMVELSRCFAAGGA